MHIKTEVIFGYQVGFNTGGNVELFNVAGVG
jgi:hypothetical protein